MSLHYSWRLDNPKAAGLIWKHVLEVVVRVAHGDAHDVDGRRGAEQQREAAQHPGQVGRLKVDEAEEVHANERIAAAPHVHEHDGERVAQEHCIYEKG